MRHGIVFALLLVSVAAQANLLLNGSFDSGNPLPGTNTYESVNPGSPRITGWTVSTAEIAWLNGSSFGITSFDGPCSLDLFGFHDSAPSGVISQSITTVVGQAYRTSFAVGSYNGNISLVRVQAGAQFADFANPNGNNTWQTATWTFVATSTSTLLSFSGSPLSAQTVHAGLDAVSVDAVPEPAPFAALGLGGLAMLRRRRRA